MLQKQLYHNSRNAILGKHRTKCLTKIMKLEAFQPNRSGGVVFYVNGVEVDRLDASSLRTGMGPFLIGNNQWPDQTYHGLIDDVRLHRP
jgi:hypothetical protein